MKQTLLQMSQDIASSMSSDEFNSINDTTESLQIANCIKQVYFNMVAKYDLPENNQPFQLNGSGDNTKPVLMYRPDGIARIEWIKYYNTNVAQEPPDYEYVDILPLEDFLRETANLDPALSTVDTMTLSIAQEATGTSQNFTFNYINDRQPKCCTIISDYYLVFDSFDNTQDSILVGSKTFCLGWITPAWSNTDSFIPVIDENMFPMLFNEAKSLAFFELKQQPHQKAEQEITRQRSSLQKFKGLTSKPLPFDELPNFGRSSRRGGGIGR